eukprot:TRINITY_DN25945_c0_g1_i1.p1 TRINITY_DN25945_c0_g1~~TRINITY_DN25945_c0_g1_i1.p1  ORF type:complete len:455 (+),score=120.51 TRINITY_DN25945_c0_g1_i1:394-1758(+)
MLPEAGGACLLGFADAVAASFFCAAIHRLLDVFEDERPGSRSASPHSRTPRIAARVYDSSAALPAAWRQEDAAARSRPAVPPLRLGIAARTASPGSACSPLRIAERPVPCFLAARKLRQRDGDQNHLWPAPGDRELLGPAICAQYAQWRRSGGLAGPNSGRPCNTRRKWTHVDTASLLEKLRGLQLRLSRRGATAESISRVETIIGNLQRERRMVLNKRHQYHDAPALKSATVPHPFLLTPRAGSASPPVRSASVDRSPRRQGASKLSPRGAALSMAVLFAAEQRRTPRQRKGRSSRSSSPSRAQQRSPSPSVSPDRSRWHVDATATQPLIVRRRDDGVRIAARPASAAPVRIAAHPPPAPRITTTPPPEAGAPGPPALAPISAPAQPQRALAAPAIDDDLARSTPDRLSPTPRSPGHAVARIAAQQVAACASASSSRTVSKASESPQPDGGCL